MGRISATEREMSKRIKDNVRSISKESSGKVKKTSSKGIKLTWKDDKPVIDTRRKGSAIKVVKKKKPNEITGNELKKNDSLKVATKETDSLVNEVIPMDTDDAVMKELQLLREEKLNSCQSNYNNINYQSAKKRSLKENEKKIVIDTNIYINNLDLIKMALHNNYIIVVPYIVVQELDNLKDRKQLTDDTRIKAREAINFLLSSVENPKSNVLFTEEDVSEVWYNFFLLFNVFYLTLMI